MLAGRCLSKTRCGCLGSSSQPALSLWSFHRGLSYCSTLRKNLQGHSCPLRSSNRLWYRRRKYVTQAHHMLKRQCSSLASEDSLQTHQRSVLGRLAKQKPPTCSGCGSILQCDDLNKQGYISEDKLQKLVESLANRNATDDMAGGREEGEVVAESVTEKRALLTCKRCFSLKHYNTTALNITLKEDDYLRHLAHLQDKRALILLVVDVIDFPGSLFPNLHTLISQDSHVVIVANKIDLLPKGVDGNFWNRLRTMILDECEGSSLKGCSVSRVIFTSVKSGEGLGGLATSVEEYWGNRGDVYLLGCTNVGKSSLFNHLLKSLCGASPGQLDAGHGFEAPSATISHWPGTTLGLLSFPIMSVGKRRRLLAQQVKGNDEMALQRRGERIQAQTSLRYNVQPTRVKSEAPQNRFWLHDTPGAINEAQLINLLTTKELNLALPKKPLKPRTFILRPGQCLLLGGLARLDYLDGAVSVYFTVFAATYIPIHVTRVDKADSVWTRNLGAPLLKLPCGDSDRLARFPALQPQLVTVEGAGWNSSTADVILSSAGWVAVTAGYNQEVCLMAHTPAGRGIHCRQPALWPGAVTLRGKRRRTPNHRATFIGK